MLDIQRDLFADVVDVVVTDGFTGNIVIKTVEGTARAFSGAVRDARRSSRRAGLGGRLLGPELNELGKIIDPDSTGGAILLGLRGVAVVGHGSSGPVGIANAARVAARSVQERTVERTAELLTRSGATRAMLRDRKPDTPEDGVADLSAAGAAPAKQAL